MKKDATTRLREAHAHLPAHGRALSMLSVADCTGAADCLKRLTPEARRARPGSWILAHGARVETWPGRRWPTVSELDQAVGGRPCCVLSFDHHALVASSAALRAAGIRDDAPDPKGGIIVRDDRARPTGLLLEKAASLVWNAAPEPSRADRRQHVWSALTDLARHGFAEVHDLLSPSWLGPMLAEMDDAGQVPMKIVLFVPIDDLEAAARSAQSWQRDRVRLGGAKLFADGTLNSRTAWTLTDYADPLPGMPRGKIMATPEEIEAAIRRCDALGLPLATHAIGDGAVRAVLDAIKRAKPKTKGFRIEHAELIDENDVDRFASLGVIASVQPCHLLTDIEALRRLLPHRLDRVLPLRELIDAGCTPGELLFFGSDTPIVRADPGDSILAATKRRREGAPRSDAIAFEQAITESESWACFRAPPQV